MFNFRRRSNPWILTTIYIAFTLVTLCPKHLLLRNLHHDVFLTLFLKADFDEAKWSANSRRNQVWACAVTLFFERRNSANFFSCEKIGIIPTFLISRRNRRPFRLVEIRLNSLYSYALSIISLSAKYSSWIRFDPLLCSIITVRFIFTGGIIKSFVCLRVRCTNQQQCRCVWAMGSRWRWRNNDVWGKVIFLITVLEVLYRRSS